MTPITRPCPHCGRDYDISTCLNGDRVWCRFCGKWSVVIMPLVGGIYLSPCDAPDGTAPAQETTAAAALVAELSALRAELEAARQTIREILGEFSREMRYVPADQEQRWRRVAGLSEMKE